MTVNFDRFSDDTWLFILISSCAGVIVLGTLLAMLLMKCKKSYAYYQDSSAVMKHPPIPPAAGDVVGPKGAPIHGTMLYHPFVPSAHYQSALGADNRMLWATLTPHGTTQHFISENFVLPHDDHYEVIDYNKAIQKKNLKNSFENSGFVDFDYEDPTPLMDSYNTSDDIDSGYQEPQNLSFTDGSLARTYVSTPTRIENPNLAPLNMMKAYETAATLKKSTINRRTSDASRSLKV